MGAVPGVARRVNSKQKVAPSKEVGWIVFVFLFGAKAIGAGRLSGWLKRVLVRVQGAARVLALGRLRNLNWQFLR